MIKQGISTLRRIARRLKQRYRSAPLILLYHRVSDLRPDPQLLSVTSEHFGQQLQILRQSTTPMKLQDMVRAMRNNQLPRRSVAVTFDDGYADNLYNAKPLLERYGVPGTVYVSSGYVGSGREFYPDVLERIFLQPGSLPEELHLTVNGKTHRWHLGNATHYGVDACRANAAWHVLDPESPTPRHHIYRALCQLLYALPECNRRFALDALTSWACRQSICRETHRVLRAEEVCLLARDGLVEVGSHTVDHPVLSAIPVADQRKELQESKRRLEEILDHPVTSFAYPYGTRSDYSAETVELVREAGYDHACSNFQGHVQPGVDPWQLPRFIVRDWDGDEFAAWIREWRDL